MQKKETVRRPDVDKSHNSIPSHKWYVLNLFVLCSATIKDWYLYQD